MAVQFACTVCGKRLRVGDSAAGRTFRGPDCGGVARIPDPEPPQPPTPASRGDGESGTHCTRAVVRHRNKTVRVLVAIVAVVVVVASAGYYLYSSSQEEMEGRGRLTLLVDEQVRLAEDKAEQHDFAAAKDLLQGAAAAIADSPHANVYLSDHLNGRLDTARCELDQRQATHLAEKKRQDEEESERKAEERRMAQARARREAEEARLAAEAKARQEAIAKQQRREEAEASRRAAEETRLAEEVKAREEAKAKARLEALVDSIESPVTLKVGDGELRVQFQLTTLYIPGNPHETRLGYEGFFFVTYQTSGGSVQNKPVEGYFRVNGKAEKLTVRSSDKKVLAGNRFRPWEEKPEGKEQLSRDLRYSDDYGLNLVAVGPGVASITVTMAGQSVSIPMRVVQLPISGLKLGRAAHTKDEVIEILGLPDERVERYLAWPDSATVDGIFYSAADHPRYGVSIEHWKYDKYPGAVVAFRGDKIHDVRSVQRSESR